MIQLYKNTLFLTIRWSFKEKICEQYSVCKGEICIFADARIILQMLNRVRRFIGQNNLLTPHAKVIVGLSGGMDSMVLLDVLIKLGYECMAAHCHFHLRGAESDRDAGFVKEWCERHDINLKTIDFDTFAYAGRKKISVEMAARELRYDWFETLRREYQPQAVAIAHHQDDSVETVLLNLVRGTGIRGLTGIAAKNGYIVRPLLCLTRAEVEHYVKEHAIPYVTDSTNNDDYYLRNALRLNIIPALEKLNPSVKDSIFNTSRHLAEVKKVYDDSICKAVKDVYRKDKIDIEVLLETVSPSAVLYEILSPLGFTPSTIDDALESVNAISGKTFYSDGYRLIKDRSYFILDRLSSSENDVREYTIGAETSQITSPVHLDIRIEKRGVKLDKSPLTLSADMDKLSFPLLLRKWNAGDWFVPFGMKGKKKLSDYFNDRKFSLKDKEDVWILTSKDDIVWIVGKRADNRFRISEKTDRVFIIEYRQGD
ncbi:tRNA lysidine(34) synthetase TilS [Limibacterium fermenti]|uniref:tRNA lysidine(34) synthetase TilS n=1 Tax=Limibacterium fermenti TaxID=3229863 RepID=UPI003A7478E1